MWGVEILTMALLACPAQGIDLDHLVELNAKARGGREAIESINTLRVTLHIVEPGFEADLVYHAMRPGFARVDVSNEGQPVFTEAVNDAGAWQMSGANQSPTRSSPEGTVALRHGAIGNLYGLHELEGLGHQLRMLEPETIDGILYNRLEVTAPEGGATVYFVDPGSCLVTRKRSVRAFHPDVDPTKSRIESLYSDFRIVDGVLRPFRTENRNIDTGERLGETIVTKVEVNPSLDPSLFDMPQRSTER